MRITILTFGSQGDVRPAVAMGAALRLAGHEVRLAAHSRYQRLVSDYGLEFAPLENLPNPVPRARPAEAPPRPSSRIAGWVKPWTNAIRGRSLLTDGGYLERLMNDSWKACEGADAVLASFLCWWAYHLAEKLEIPIGWTPLQPLHPTRVFPNLLFPQSRALRGPLNSLLQRSLHQIHWHFVKKWTNVWRREVLGLGPLKGMVPFPRVSRERQPILYGFSPTVVSLPDDWPNTCCATGYWFLDRLSDWSPPAELVDFLESGRPPVAITFSSMRHANPEGTTRTVLDALGRTRQRGILLTGSGALTELDDARDDVFVAHSLPHEWLFPRVSAVVHHGGAGTTAAALRAGVPSVVVPHFGDQFFWAQRLVQLGASPSPIPRKLLCADPLAAAIGEAISDRQMQRIVLGISRSIQAENGLARATELVDRYLGHATT